MLWVVTLSGFLPPATSSSVVCVDAIADPRTRSVASRMSFFMVSLVPPREYTLPAPASHGQRPTGSAKPLRPPAGPQGHERALHRLACSAFDDRRHHISQERRD